jgi:MFS family permease
MPNAGRLFNASCVALIVTAMTFAIRGGIMSELGREFSLSGTELGLIAGMAFWGFTLAMVIGGPLCDVVGMGRLLKLAVVGHIVGILCTIFSLGFWSLFFSTMLVGIANGLVEAASNPLIATLYPHEKTKKLNQFHAWFPGGIVIGGVVAVLFQRIGLSWQVQMATMLLPAAIYGWMFLRQHFPQTERVASGVSTRDMFSECLRPLFLFMLVCMLLTAGTENGTNQWMPMLLENAGVPGIVVLIYVTGLMTVLRLWAGPVERVFSSTGMLLGSAIISSIGLYWLSQAAGLSATLGAATVFAVGICYFWPTMLGFVSERMPRTGALGLALMGGAGMLSTSVVMPVIGRIYDHQLATVLPAGTTAEALQTAAAGTPEAAQWAAVQLTAGSGTLQYVVILPLVLIVAFTILILQQRGKGTVVLEQAKAAGDGA